MTRRFLMSILLFLSLTVITIDPSMQILSTFEQGSLGLVCLFDYLGFKFKKSDFYSSSLINLFPNFWYH